MANEAIGFIGLGLLGMPMATNLVAGGHAVRVYNRTASKADGLVTLGAQRADTPSDAVTPGGVVISVVWDDAALESIVTSEGFLERLGPTGVHVAMSTVLPETARKMARLHEERGSYYVEAPVFGRPEAVVAKKLWIPIAGPAAAKARIKPILEALGAQGIFDFGQEIGSAVTVKIAGNFLLVSAARSMSEALTMADKAGVDAHAVVDMLTTTLFNAPIYQTYGKRIADKLPAFQSQIPLKDVGLFLRMAERMGTSTAISGRIHELLQSPNEDVNRA